LGRGQKCQFDARYENDGLIVVWGEISCHTYVYELIIGACSQQPVIKSKGWSRRRENKIVHTMLNTKRGVHLAGHHGFQFDDHSTTQYVLRNPMVPQAHFLDNEIGKYKFNNF
jgi:hypothetical protein